MIRDERFLIVNADDFGLSRGVNAGVARACESGIVTSASLMVRQPAAADAVAVARRLPDLSVGLHVDLGEWTCRDGEWIARYEVVDLADAEAVRAEVEGQLALFRALTGADPTHLDSHQHVHMDDPARAVVAALGARIGAPVRRLDGRIRYCGEFYGDSGDGTPMPDLIGVDRLLELLENLEPGWTELGCHPAADEGAPGDYAASRAVELRTLTDPRVLAAPAALGIRLAGFGSLREAAGRASRPAAAVA